MYDRKTAKWAWLIMFIGFNIFYFSMLLLGWEGMPRRYYDYLPQFRTLHLTATFGSWILITGLIIMFGNFFHALFKGEKAADNPWGGATLEWQIPSPPPTENFEKIPIIQRGPYDFKELGRNG